MASPKSTYKFVIILLLILPLMKCESDKKENNGKSKKYYHDKDNEQGKLRTGEDAALADSKNGEASKFFAEYASSHITKEAANKLRQKMKKHKKPFVVRENEDSFRDGTGKSKRVIYDKKYFDYLPAEHLDSSPEIQTNEKRTNSRRFRRDLETQNSRHGRGARYYNYQWQPDRVMMQSRHDLNPNYQQYQQPQYVAQTNPNFQYNSPNYAIYQSVPVAEYSYQGPAHAVWQDHRPTNQYYIPQPQPQPQYFNTPTPPRQQPPFKAVTYLPPRLPLNNNFGVRAGFEDSDGFDDRSKFLVFDRNYNILPVNRAPSGGSALRPSTTQRPIVTPRPTQRPLISTTTVAPPLEHNSDYDDYYSSNDIGGTNTRTDNSINEPSRRPPTAPSPTAPPPTNSQNTQGPSACTWAIVNCCSRNSPEIRNSCFEANNCAGPFWDLKICDKSYVDRALREAAQFYNTL